MNECIYFVFVFYLSIISDLKYYLEKKRKNHEYSFTFMKHKITRTKIKRIYFYETLCVKKREIQYYAMIRMGGGVVLPMQKNEGVLSEGDLSAHCPLPTIAQLLTR